MMKIFILIVSLTQILDASAEGMFTFCANFAMISEFGPETSLIKPCDYNLPLESLYEVVVIPTDFLFFSSNLDYSLSISSATTIKANVNVTISTFANMNSIRYVVFAFPNDGYSFIKFFRFSDHPSWNTFNTGTNKRSLTYNVSFSISSSPYSLPFAFVSFSTVRFDNTSTKFTLNHTIISLTNSEVSFEISTWGDCRIDELVGTLVVLSDSLKDGIALSVERYNINQIDAVVNNASWSTAYRAGNYSFINSDIIYQTSGTNFITIGSIDLVNTGTTNIWSDLNMGADDYGNFKGQLLYYGFGSSQYNSFNFIFFSLCKPIKNCIKPVNNTLLATRNFGPYLAGTSFTRPISETRELCFNQLTVQKTSAEVKYSMLFFWGFDFARAAKFKIKSIKVQKYHVDYCVEIGPDDVIYSLYLGYFISARDGVQAYYIDFTNHSDFISVFGNAGSNRKLIYQFSFLQSDEIGDVSDALISFVEWDTNDYASEYFDLNYTIISGSSNQIVFQIESSSLISFNSLKGYILIWGKYKSLVVKDNIFFTAQTGTEVMKLTYSKTGYYTSAIKSMVNLAQFNFDASSGFTANFHITNQNDFDTTNFRLLIKSTRKIYNSDVIYSGTDQITFCSGLNYSCRFIAEPIEKTPNPFISQNCYFMSDFTKPWIFMLFVTDYCDMMDTFFNFKNDISSNPRFIYGSKFFNTTDYESSISIPPLPISLNQNITFSVIKMLNTSDCNWYGIRSNISTYSQTLDVDRDSVVASCFGSNLLPNSLSSYSTIVLRRVFYFSNASLGPVRVRVTYFGEIRALYINNQFMIKGNSSELITTSYSINSISIHQDESLILTVIGNHLIQLYDIIFLSQNSILNPESYALVELFESTSVFYNQNTTSCSMDCISCSSQDMCFLCKSGYMLLNGTCFPCNLTRQYEYLSNISSLPFNMSFDQIFAIKNIFCECDIPNCSLCENDSCSKCKQSFNLTNNTCILNISTNTTTLPNQTNNQTIMRNFTCIIDSDCPKTGSRCVKEENTTYYNCVEPPEVFTTLVKSVDVIVSAIVASAGPMIFIGGDPTLMWSMANLLQLFYYMLFFNVNYPSNVKGFLEIFALGRLNFLPNPFENLMSENESTLPSPPNFYDNNFSGMIIQSSGTFIAINLMMILYFIGLKIMMKVDFKYPWINNFLKEQYDSLRWGGILRTYLGTYYELSICAFLQITVLNMDSLKKIVSSILGVFFAIMNFAAPFLAHIILQRIKKVKNNEKRFRPLIEDYDISDDFKRNFMVFVLLRRILQALGLVFLYYTPLFQALLVWLPNFVILTLLINKRPHFRSLLNNLDIAQESILLVIHSIVILYAYNDSLKNILLDDQKYGLGWIIIGLCSLTLLANFLMLLIEQFKSVKFIISVIKRRCSKNKSVTPKKNLVKTISSKKKKLGIKNKKHTKARDL